MKMFDEPRIELIRDARSCRLLRTDYSDGSKVAVVSADTWRLSFSGKEGFLSVSCDVEWSAKRPNELASFTSDCPGYYHPGSVVVDDLGQLQALTPPSSMGFDDYPDHLEFRQGFTVRVPLDAVPLVREAIAMATAWAGEGGPQAHGD